VVRTWRVARLYSEIALSRKPFRIGHICINTFVLLRMNDTVTSHKTNLSSWDILYMPHMCLCNKSEAAGFLLELFPFYAGLQKKKVSNPFSLPTVPFRFLATSFSVRDVLKYRSESSCYGTYQRCLSFKMRILLHFRYPCSDHSVYSVNLSYLILSPNSAKNSESYHI
jgi:hypothetical protein